MAAFELQKSMESAKMRFVERARRRRSDAGRSRLDPRVEKELRRLLRGQERPPMRDVRAKLGRFCQRHRLRLPSRATIYNAIPRVPGHVYSIARLPAPVREALYNLDDHGAIQGHQVAFYAFQYGDTRAMSFAAGLPWLDLVHAERLRGWRARSLGLLRAVLAARAIA
jgi:hypothetical protein